MNRLVIAVLLLIVPGIALAQTARTDSKTIACASYSGIKAVPTQGTVNSKQLESIGCKFIDHGIKLRILPPTNAHDIYLHVAADLPDQIVQFWVNSRDMLEISPY